MRESDWLFHLVLRKKEISQRGNRDASTKSRIWFIRPRNASWNSRTTGPTTKWLGDKLKPSTDSNGLDIKMLRTRLPNVEQILLTYTEIFLPAFRAVMPVRTVFRKEQRTAKLYWLPLHWLRWLPNVYLILSFHYWFCYEVLVLSKITCNITVAV